MSINSIRLSAYGFRMEAARSLSRGKEMRFWNLRQEE